MPPTGGPSRPRFHDRRKTSFATPSLGIARDAAHFGGGKNWASSLSLFSPLPPAKKGVGSRKANDPEEVEGLPTQHITILNYYFLPSVAQSPARGARGASMGKKKFRSGAGWQNKNEKQKMYKARDRVKLTAALGALKAARGCEDGSTVCGKPHDPEVLEWDHVRGVKGHRDGIAGCLKAGWGQQRIEQEVANCVVRCANCHRKKTAADIRTDRTAGRRVGRLHERDDD